MASISSIITSGFGAPGSSSLVITDGFGTGAEVVQVAEFEVTPGTLPRSAYAAQRKALEAAEAKVSDAEIDWSLVTRRLEASIARDRKANMQKLLLLMAA